jgi:hypothetical protein
MKEPMDRTIPASSNGGEAQTMGQVVKRRLGGTQQSNEFDHPHVPE